jgi:RimJ/RimL family protein N-acetyltransferase
MTLNGQQVTASLSPDPIIESGLISCARTFDVDIVTQVYHDERIWEPTRSDDDPMAEEIDFASAVESRGDNHIFISALVANVLVGLFMFEKKNPRCYEIHSAILPEYWGSGISVPCGVAACKWMMKHTICQKITTSVPSFNEPARRMAIDAGMKQEGCNRKSFLKDGTLFDQYLFGFTEEDLSCQ